MAKVPGFAKAFAGRWRIVATSTYTMATIQASFANAAEFFNSLLSIRTK